MSVSSLSPKVNTLGMLEKFFLFINIDVFLSPTVLTCSKWRTLKTSSGTVSIQAQHVRYKCQPGHKQTSS